MSIHATAIVSPEARIGRDVAIGPYSVVEGDVVIGDGCRLESRVTVKQGTTLGRNNHLLEGAVIGGLPQHAKMPERVGRVEIGTSNVIREYVTIHRALEEDAKTVVGDYNLIMVGSHIAHDCQVGNLTLMANNVMLYLDDVQHLVHRPSRGPVVAKTSDRRRQVSLTSPLEELNSNGSD